MVGWEQKDGAVCGSRRGRKKRVGCFRPCFAGKSRDKLGTVLEAPGAREEMSHAGVPEDDCHAIVGPAVYALAGMQN